MNMFEDKFPGNKAVLEKISAAIQNGAIAFTGAGTSMPKMPSWPSLLQRLIENAKSDGRISQDDVEELRSEKDTLYLADRLSEIFGNAQLKSKVAEIFSGLTEPTDAHVLLAKANFSRYMTLNYDNGIEIAAANIMKMHLQSITPKQDNELRNWMNLPRSTEKQTVLHWHGITTHADDIIFTGDDYANLYDYSAKYTEILRDILRSNHVIMIGFGFTDPFIIRQLESVMRPMASDNRHFAVVGIDINSTVNIISERKKYAKKYKIELVFYPVLVKSDGSRDHSSLIDLLSIICHNTPENNFNQLTSNKLIKNIQKEPSYKENLFTVGHRQIYCEPQISTANLQSFSPGSEETLSKNTISVSEIVNSESHTCIYAPHEFGLTTLGKRISFDILDTGLTCIFGDASLFPNYRKKLILIPELANFTNGEKFSVILDNFSPFDHARLPGEMMRAFPGIRIILLQRTAPSPAVDSGFLEENNFQVLELCGMRRKDIRTVVSTFLEGRSDDQISTVVEKIYCDLLQLCIPLTPSNIIMYCDVLCKENDFSPVSRLQIVEKFISQALQRPSDPYTASFNFTNKLDLISHFCYELFKSGHVDFTISDWRNYCTEYKINTLSRFNNNEILSDLVEGRIVRKNGDKITFRYRMFFSYFAGRHIALRPSLLNECIENDDHVSLDGMVEIICGIAPDSTIVLNDLTKKLKNASDKFYSEYPINGFCLHTGVRWVSSNTEGEVWDKITSNLDDGPSSSDKIDKLKTSIQSEQRTVDQKVSIIEFAEFEKNISAISWQLHIAIESATYASATAKIEGLLSVIGGVKTAYEVANLFAPMIADKKYVSWNGFRYINQIENDRTDLDASQQRSAMLETVIFVIPSCIVQQATNEFGSRKLGPIFSKILKDKEQTGFTLILLFSLLIRSKPEGWTDIAKNIIASTKRDDIFLYHMLGLSMYQFKNELNTILERSMLKETIARIHVRRTVGAKKSSKTSINAVIDKNKDVWGD